MKKILLSLVAVAMATATFAQSWVGTQFEISAGGNCDMEAPVEAERFCEFTGQWGSITPSIRDFDDSVYKQVVVKLAEPLDVYYNVPYKDPSLEGEAAQKWNASATNGPGATQFTIDITSLHSIKELSIQHVETTKHSFTITEAYAVKLDDTKVPLTFTGGWNANVLVKGIKSGNPTFKGQWASLNISNDILGKAGKKVLRIYANTDLNAAPIQWCIKTTGGKDAWPQIDKSTGECVIKDNVQSCFLQWTSTTPGTIGIDAITWELIPFASTTLNAEGYATFSAEDDLYVATEGVTAYKAVVEGENITLVELDNPTIPAGTGVILYGTPGTEVKFDCDAAKDKATNLADNALKATTTATENIVSKPAGTLWALGAANEFQKYTGTEFVANRAFLVHETSAANMRMVIEDEATGISEVKSIKKENCKIFDNGKVIIVKNGVKYNVSGQQIK